VREDGQANRYRGLGINYVEHHNPDLLMFDDSNNELHRIDLTRLQTTDSMHKLMLLLGLQEVCRDANGDCREWASQGECKRNPDFMSNACRKSCDVCSENATIDEKPPCRDLAAAHDCQYWSTMGQCEENKAFMVGNCARSCGVCSDSGSGMGDGSEDKDEL